MKKILKIFIVSFLGLFLFSSFFASVYARSCSDCQYLEGPEAIADCYANCEATPCSQCGGDIDCLSTCTETDTGSSGTGSNTDSSSQGSGSGGGSVSLKDPLGIKDPRVIIKNVINTMLGLVGSLALAVFIFGGFTWVISAGSEEKIKKGKDMVMWAALGLMLIFTSYALINIVLTAIAG